MRLQRGSALLSPSLLPPSCGSSWYTFCLFGIVFFPFRPEDAISPLGMAASRMALAYISGEQRGHGQVNRRRLFSVGRFCFMPWLQSLFVLALRLGMFVL